MLNAESSTNSIRSIGVFTFADKHGGSTFASQFEAAIYGN
jgi:hypothetical protein